jgi:hypothetical protein
MMPTTFPPPPCLLSGLPGPSRFLARPQLLTRGSPLPVGRDIPQPSQHPNTRVSNRLSCSETDTSPRGPECRPIQASLRECP